MQVFDGFDKVRVMRELVFEVTQEADGGFTAEALGESIFTQSDSWEDLRRNVADAVEAYYFDSDKPAQVRLRLIRDEMLAVG
ncbi:MAG: 2-phospho-L-lactate guanylyltransferase [Acidobacteriaceae bacterium]